MRTLEHLINLIKYSPLTEKTVKLKESGIYTFIVCRSMTKLEIKEVISSLFNIKIASINASTMPIKIKKVGKFSGKQSRFKKAYIKTIKPFENADLLFPI